MTLLLYSPGVHRAQEDTSLLIESMQRGDYAAGRSVLDVGTGCGALALAAARAGAETVAAVDLSLRAVLTARANCRLNRLPVTVHRGDLFGPVCGKRFGLVITNPPYAPARGRSAPRHRRARSWDAGHDGRLLLDRICAGVPHVLSHNGVLLLVQSALSGEEATLAGLTSVGLHAEVVERRRIPFGPVLRRRLPMLRDRGLLGADETDEELVVIKACRPHLTATDR